MRTGILGLQLDQLRHDELYHKDVVIMPLGERVKHMALHVAKYTGSLADALEADDAARIERVLTDAFVITLATANTLNQHLGRDLGLEASGDASLAELGAAALRQLARPDREPFWLLRMFARHGGALAKACESLDHLEDYPFRNAMRESNLNLFRLVIAEAVARRIDLDDRYRARLRQVEGRVIFDEAWRSNRSAIA